MDTTTNNAKLVRNDDGYQEIWELACGHRLAINVEQFGRRTGVNAQWCNNFVAAELAKACRKCQ